MEAQIKPLMDAQETSYNSMGHTTNGSTVIGSLVQMALTTYMVAHTKNKIGVCNMHAKMGWQSGNRKPPRKNKD